jgi:hypothetical protein
MSIVRQNGLSPDAAEAYLAHVWCLLEEFGIESPSLLVAERDGGLLDLSLVFGVSAHAEQTLPNRIAGRQLRGNSAASLGERPVPALMGVLYSELER